jgi:NADPH:quinone reductase-like Zn-dependent oxidoreductase
VKAVLFTEYGPPEVLRLAAGVPMPKPGPRDLLIRVRATSVTAAECMMRRGDTAMARAVLGLRAPRPRYRVMGSELAGDVVAVGREVARYRPGDRVYGFTGFRQGAYAEYACLPEGASIAPMPAGLGYESAAALADGATTALFFLLRKARLRAGRRLLVIGASGSIGAYAVQIAAGMGARVEGVCGAANADLVRSLGAERVFDYAKEDFSRSGEEYDLVFDAVGKSSFARCAPVLSERGAYLRTTGGPLDFARTLWSSAFARKKYVYAMSIDKREELAALDRLVREGKVRPIVDRRYPLEQIAEAHAYVEAGHKRGNVVVTVGSPE